MVVRRCLVIRRSGGVTGRLACQPVFISTLLSIVQKTSKVESNGSFLLFFVFVVKEDIFHCINQ